jgi:hypothetical protein
MTPMSPPENFRIQWSLRLALLLSLIVHGAILLFPTQSPRVEERAATRLEATLAQKPRMPPKPATPVVVPSPAAARQARPQPQRKILAMDKAQGVAATPATPRWSVAQKEEMNSFLRELDGQARQAPDLAQRSLAMARDIGRQLAAQEKEGSEVLERLPNSPPVDPFSLEMYLDSLVRKLNRSAGFVRNDPRARGLKVASVEIRLNPSGSLKSFKVLNAADQQDEIAFVRSVVEQSVPFAPFPADIGKSAKSLAMVICIMPANSSGGGFGFTRNPGARGC